MQVGGQAVLEGVMMRAPGMVATAVRRANGEIVIQKDRHRSLGERFAAFRLPIIRGALGLIEMMVIGMRTLNFSAEVAMRDAGFASPADRDGNDGEVSPSASRLKDGLKLGLTLTSSLAVGVAVFFVTPLFLATALFHVDQDPFLFNVIAGVVRIGLLLAYLAGISMMKEIKRLFQYHGAEHKAVFAFEKGEELTVAAARRQSRFHPRCGTSFLLIVMIVAILLFSVLDALVIQWVGHLTLPTRLLTHLPLIPLVGGISYEFIRASAKRSDTVIGRMVVAPGLWLQKITTREPDESMLEVALVALQSALSRDKDIVPSPNATLFQETSVVG